MGRMWYYICYERILEVYAMTLDWLSILILAAVRGLTGILPLSDSGVQTVARSLMGLPMNGEADGFLDGLCILAVTIAICIVYHGELRACLRRPRGRRATEEERLGRRQWMLIVSSFVFSIPGLLFGNNISFMGNLVAVAVLSIVNGFVLFAWDRMSIGGKGLTEATIGDAAAIGIGQSLSVIPGFSRMGFTMSFGVFRGLDPSYCLQFSLLAAVPYYIIRALVLIISSAMPEGGIVLYLVGMALCGIIAYLALRLLRFSVRRGSAVHASFISWGLSLLLFMLYLVS